jgi:hypothetical protein
MKRFSSGCRHVSACVFEFWYIHFRFGIHRPSPHPPIANNLLFVVVAELRLGVGSWKNWKIGNVINVITTDDR